MRRWLRLFGLALFFLSGLGGCNRDFGLQRFSTTTPAAPLPSQGPTQTPLPTLPPTPTILVTAPPAVALPDASGTSVACAANTLRLPLAYSSGDAIGAASRILAHGDWLYLLAGGGLYRIDRLNADAGLPELEPVLRPGENIAGRPAQELTDLAADASRNLIYTLDKVGHVFRYEVVGGRKTVTYRSAPDRQGAVTPQLVAIEVDQDGRLIILDSAHGTLWTPDGISAFDLVNDSRGLTTGRDVAAAGGKFYVLRHSGEIREVTTLTGWSSWRDAGDTQLGLSLKTSDHLGVEVLYLVDGLRREVTGITPGDARDVTRLAFSFHDMGLLRDVVFAGGRMYAIADNSLFIYPGSATDTGSIACPPPSTDSYSRPTLYDVDVIGALHGASHPIEDGTLPEWPRVYPGASRPYRMGIHHGLDIYRYNGPVGFGKGWPVVAMFSGEVIRATLLYDELTPEVFNEILAEAEAMGLTPPDTMTRLAGKHVVVDHGNGVTTVYMHLDEIASGVVTGARVRSGQVIGTVGVTGTEGEVKRGAVSPHLHAEIWLGDRYLGQGITLRETMWWFEQLFGGLS